MEDGKLRGPVHPVWASYRHLIKNAKVFVNGTIDVAEAEQLLLDGTADLIVCGRSWLVNPDYANRIFEGVKPVSTFDFTVSYLLILSHPVRKILTLDIRTLLDIPRVDRMWAILTGPSRPSTTSPLQSSYPVPARFIAEG